MESPLGRDWIAHRVARRLPLEAGAVETEVVRPIGRFGDEVLPADEASRLAQELELQRENLALLRAVHDELGALAF